MSGEQNRVGLALSGGGSRAVAFHYGVLEAFYDLNLVKKIDVVSAISGGAIIGALFNLYASNRDALKEKIEFILKDGLQSSLYRKLFDIRWLLHQGVHPDSLADILDKKLFHGILLKDIPERPLLILNATDLKRGCGFKFGKEVCGSYRDGGFVLPSLRLSQAVAYSAAFTLCLSVKKLRLSENEYAYLTDGGVYDGLGVNALFPDKDEKSILSQSCETIIVSDASFPYQENPPGISFFAKNRLESAHYCSGQRNRSLIYNKLFLLQKSGQLKNVGTIKMDSKHADLTEGWKDEELKFINRYRTDFKPVVARAASLLKGRGEREAHVIVSKHLSNLIGGNNG